MLGLRHLNSSLIDVTQRSVLNLLLVSEMRTLYLGMIPKVYARATALDVTLKVGRSIPPFSKTPRDRSPKSRPIPSA